VAHFARKTSTLASALWFSQTDPSNEGTQEHGLNYTEKVAQEASDSSSTVQKCSNPFSSETRSDSVVTVAVAAAVAAAAAADCDDHGDDQGDDHQHLLMNLLLPPFPCWTCLLLTNHLVFVFVKCEREILVGEKRRQIETDTHTLTLTLNTI